MQLDMGRIVRRILAAELIALAFVLPAIPRSCVDARVSALRVSDMRVSEADRQMDRLFAYLAAHKTTIDKPDWLEVE